jgi:drug/metabolite transporter (DMT)-like permease
VLSAKSNASIVAGLLLAVTFWGGNNAGTKWLVQTWPPVWIGTTRFFCAGLLLLGLLRFTKLLGTSRALRSEIKRRLWWRGGLSLATYIVAFTYAVKFTSASHVALYLGAAPVWALLWEGLSDRMSHGAWRYAAATLALTGVFVLLWPALRDSHANLLGEILGLASSILWTNYGRQCRSLAATLSGAEVSAHTMWRGGALLLPIIIAELIARKTLPLGGMQIAVQSYCILAGGVFAFAIWSNALRHWSTSRVFLFNNLIPLSTMTWAHFCIGEAITPTFWVAMILVAAGVVLGQMKFQTPTQATPVE